MSFRATRNPSSNSCHACQPFSISRQTAEDQVKPIIWKTMPVSWFLLTGLLVATAALTGCQPIRPATTHQASLLRWPIQPIRPRSPRKMARLSSISPAQPALAAPNFNLVPENATQTVTLRFHLAGLEELQVHDGKTTFTISIASTPPHAVHETMQLNTETAPVQLMPASDEWIPVQIISQHPPGETVIPIQNGYIDVVLPPTMADSR